MRLHKPIGIFLLLWPTLWALWIAGQGSPDPLVLFVFIAGVVLMRSAGCVINDYADRNFDPHVERTRGRPLASGQVFRTEAVMLFLALCLCAFALVLLMNRLTVVMSLAAAALAAIYPFTKRHTQLPQLVLGAAFGWAVPMAFAAETGQVPLVAWTLFVATVLWATVYDTMYAMVDRSDDLKIGLKSTAILFGSADRVVIGALQIATIGVLWIAGEQVSLGFSYRLGLGVAAGFFAYQQLLIRDREPEPCFRAFLNNNWFGLVVFAGISIDYLGWGRPP